MTDQELKELVASLAESQKKTDEQQRKTDELQRETNQEMRESQREFDRRMLEVQKELGSIGNRDGRILEEEFLNSLKKNPEVGGVQFDKVLGRYQLGHQAEYDIVLLNGEHVLAVEVKKQAKRADVRHFARQLPLLHEVKRFSDKKLLGALASELMEEGTEQEAEDAGFYLLKLGERGVEIANPSGENFSPRTY